jgi:DsbC/DsbD-like thiol-disulfide interchange protein
MEKAIAPILVAGLLLFATASPAPESAPEVRPGIRSVRLLAETTALVPGEPLWIGLLLDPEPDHHTYWRGPGIVGVATRLDWSLPPGFAAGPILWPPPETVLMAGIVAHGYRSQVLLLSRVSVPAEVEGDEVVLAASASWMACAVSCNPGVAELSLRLPVDRSGKAPPRDELLSELFEKARAALPPPAPEGWAAVPRLPSPDRIELELVVPGLGADAAGAVRFFSDDMQVDSDRPQRLEWIDPARGAFRLVLARPEFAPKSPSHLSGLLHLPDGWPEIGSPFVEFSVPWPAGALSDQP